MNYLKIQKIIDPKKPYPILEKCHKNVEELGNVPPNKPALKVQKMKTHICARDLDDCYFEVK